MNRNASQTRIALLDAGERLFSRRGYAAVGIREIADEAGANLGSISYHFGSKRELYLETVRRVMAGREGGSAWDALRTAPAGPFEAAVQVARFIRGYRTSLLEEGDHQVCGALMLWEAVQPSDAIDAVVTDFIRPGHEALRELIRPLLAADDRPRAGLFARSILGQVLHYGVFRPFIERLRESQGDAARDPRAEAEEATGHVARFSLRAMGHDDDFVDRVLAASAEDDIALAAAPVAANIEEHRDEK